MSDTRTLNFDFLPTLGEGYRKVVFLRKKGLRKGETLPRIEAHVAGIHLDREKYDRYLSLCRFPGEDLPPTYPQVLAGPLHLAMLCTSEFPISALGLVHTENRIVLHRPIDPAETFTLDCHIEGHRDVDRGVEIDLITELSAGGEGVWTAVSTMLSITKKRADKAKDKNSPPKGDAPGNERSVIFTVGSDAGRRYAAVSGDYNPIHLYPLTAKLFGFKRPIAHGMWTLARCVAEMDRDVDPGAVILDVKFKRPVMLPTRALFVSSPERTGKRFVLSSPESGRIYLEGHYGPRDERLH